MLQADVALALDVPVSELSQYETGQRRPKVHVYLKASEVLEATVDELLLQYDAVMDRTEAACG